MPRPLVAFVGDVHVDRDDPIEAFAHVRDILREPAIVFGNLEGAYSDEAPSLSSFSGRVCSAGKNLEAYAAAGFKVMSLANNHVADAGHEAMLRTRACLRCSGIATCGAGHSKADAHEPAILDVEGVRIAFLAYASVFPIGWEAREHAPGLAPIRAYSQWQEPSQTVMMPGALPRVTTVPDRTDLGYLADDIRRAGERADLVVASFHWGDQFRSFHLTDHEVRTARFCIEQGAHMVVGHHHHALRGMEWYKGRPIMYGLGHFVFDVRWEWTEAEVRRFAASEWGRYCKDIQYEGGPQQGWPLLAFPQEYRMTVIAWARATECGISQIGFLPCRIRPDGQVYPVKVDSAEGMEVIEYFARCNRTQGLDSQHIVDESEVIGGFSTVRVIPRT